MISKREEEESRRGPAQRHGTSQASTLPVWQAERGEARGTLNITCPYKDCGGKAVVNAKKWKESRPDFIGRSCTYCFRTARLP